MGSITIIGCHASPDGLFQKGRVLAQDGDQAQGKPLLTALPYASSLQECETKKAKFQDGCRRKGLPEAAHVLDEDGDRIVSVYSFPKPHGQHLRTSNVVESPFAALRLRTDAAKRFKKVESATAVIFKLLLDLYPQKSRHPPAPICRSLWMGQRGTHDPQDCAAPRGDTKNASSCRLLET